MTTLLAHLAEARSRLGIELLVIGGHAVNAYGYSRTTLDFDVLIATPALEDWRGIFESAGYRWIGQTETLVRFDPPQTDPPSLPLDVMLVNPDTFLKMQAGRRLLSFGAIQLPVPSPLHLIALKLHALKNPERFKKGKDLPDILHLISNCQIDTGSKEFQRVLHHYASDETRRLLDISLR